MWWVLLQKHDILFCWSKTKFKSTKEIIFKSDVLQKMVQAKKKNVFVVQRQNWSWKTKLNLAKRNHFKIRRFAKKWCKPKILHFLLFCCKTKLNSTIGIKKRNQKESLDVLQKMLQAWNFHFVYCLKWSFCYRKRKTKFNLSFCIKRKDVFFKFEGLKTVKSWFFLQILKNTAAS